MYRPREIYKPFKGRPLPAQEKRKVEWLMKRATQMRNKPTPLEIKMELVLDLLNINHKRQHVIGNFIVDFYLPAYKAIIEADGRSHETFLGRKKDKKRNNALIYHHKCRILHVRWFEFFSVEHMQKKIMEFLTGVNIAQLESSIPQKQGDTSPTQDGL